MLKYSTKVGEKELPDPEYRPVSCSCAVTGNKEAGLFPGCLEK